MKQNEEIIAQTIAFVKHVLSDAEGGHDWLHIERVYHNATEIAKHEDVDQLVVSLGSLLHDIADAKFHGGDEEIGPAKAKRFLESIDVEDHITDHVVNIVKYVSYKSGMESHDFYSKELAVVQDADRLDAIGAIGIARCFHYGGFKGNAIYDPEVKPQLDMSKEAYKKGSGPSINHFYEKLLLLSDMMNTDKGREMAEERHDFLLTFLKQFFKEVGGR